MFIKLFTCGMQGWAEYYSVYNKIRGKKFYVKLQGNAWLQHS
jgi:hypothetical protein